MCPGPGRERAKDLTIRSLSARERLTLAAHVGKILGKGNESGALTHRLENALLGIREIRVQVIGRAKLNDGNPHLRRVQPRK